MDEEPGFIGGATFYLGETKVDVHVRLYRDWGSSSPERWWGTYNALLQTVASGTAYARFSDGSEGDIKIDADDDHCGSFVLTSPLADSTTRPRPDI